MFATRIIADKRSQCKKLILRIPSSNGGAALYMVAVDIIYMLPSDKKKKICPSTACRAAEGYRGSAFAN